MAWLTQSIERAAQVAGGAIWLGFCGATYAEPVTVTGVALTGLAAVLVQGLRKYGLDNGQVLKGIQKNARARVEQKLGSATEQFDLRDADRALAEALPHCVPDRDALVSAANDVDGFSMRAAGLIMAELALKEPRIFGEDAPKTGRDFAKTVVQAALDAAVNDPEYFEKLRPHLDLQAQQNLAKLLRIQSDQASVIASIREDAAVARLLMEQIVSSGTLGGNALGLNEAQVRVILTAFGKQHIPIDQAERVLLEAAQELLASRTRFPEESNMGDQGASSKVLLAQDAIDRADFEFADELLASAARLDLDSGASQFLRAAASTAQRAAIAFALAKFEEAAELYGRAADIAGPLQPKPARMWRAFQAAALQEHGRLFAGTKSLDRAIQIFRTLCLPNASYEVQPDEWASIQMT